MAIIRIQPPGHKEIVILLDAANLGILQQGVTGIHLDAEGVQRIDDLIGVGDDRLLGIGQLGQKVLLQRSV